MNKSRECAGFSTMFVLFLISLPLLALGLWFIIAFAIPFSISYRHDIQEGSRAKKYRELAKVGVDQSQADELASKAFIGVNDHRKQKNLPLLEQDENLCVYAQRRLEQLDKSEGGFYKDTGDPAIWKTYFSSYSGVNEDSYSPLSPPTDRMSIGDEVDIIVGSWFQKGIITDGKYTNACVKANRHFIVIIIGVKK